MPKVTKTKKKGIKTKIKEIKKASKKTVKPVKKLKETKKFPPKISKNYIPKDTEKYMCEKHKIFLE